MNEKLKANDEIFKPAIMNFKRRHIYAYFNNDLFSADLVDYQKLSKYNKGYHFLLTVIDIYSRYAWVIPLKNKTKESVFEGFKSIEQTPKNLWVDEGGEFFNRIFEKYCKDNDINLYHTYSEIKGAFIERFNRTLKESISKYLEYNNTYTYINELEKIVEKYNKRIHSITKARPIDIYNGSKIPKQLQPIHGTEPKFQVGDYVRISKIKNFFEKGYTPKWSKEVFKIVEIHKPPYPIMYSLVDLKDEEITGKFYEQEMLKTDLKDVKLFEKVIKQKKDGNGYLYYVKYQGYEDEKFNEWMTKDELTELRGY